MYSELLSNDYEVILYRMGEMECVLFRDRMPLRLSPLVLRYLYSPKLPPFLLLNAANILRRVTGH